MAFPVCEQRRGGANPAGPRECVGEKQRNRAVRSVAQNDKNLGRFLSCFFSGFLQWNFVVLVLCSSDFKTHTIIILFPRCYHEVILPLSFLTRPRPLVLTSIQLGLLIITVTYTLIATSLTSGPNQDSTFPAASLTETMTVAS
jgi:hypothetical protein